MLEGGEARYFEDVEDAIARHERNMASPEDEARTDLVDPQLQADGQGPGAVADCAKAIQPERSTSPPIGPSRSASGAGAQPARSASRATPACSSAQTSPGPTPGDRSRSPGAAAGGRRL